METFASSVDLRKNYLSTRKNVLNGISIGEFGGTRDTWSFEYSGIEVIHPAPLQRAIAFIAANQFIPIDMRQAVPVEGDTS
jgi:hypothetical protein